MKEARWLAETAAPDSMLKYACNTVTDRKLRLFAVACCRRIWDLIPSEEGRSAVEVTERFAEGSATLEELTAARLSAGRSGVTVAKKAAAEPALTAAKTTAWDAQVLAADAAYEAAGSPESYRVRDTAWDAATRAHCDLIRDLINPFRPVTLDPSWLTPTVRQLAQAAYGERILPSGELDMDRLRVLADALEEAGCNDPQILSHCRGNGPHVRGCFVVDLLLGRQ